MPWEFLRSQPMSLCQIMVSVDAIYSCVTELGVLGIAEFTDKQATTTSTNKRFLGEIKRLQDLENSLAYMMSEMQNAEIDIDPWDDMQIRDSYENTLPELEALLEGTISKIKTTGSHIDGMNRQYHDFEERKHVLVCLDHLFSKAAELKKSESLVSAPAVQEMQLSGGKRRGRSRSRSRDRSATRNNKSKIGVAGSVAMDVNAMRFGPGVAKISFVAGVLLRTQVPAFQRMIFRVGKGNALVRTTEIEFDLYDPVAQDESTAFVAQSMFVVFYQSDSLLPKLRKVCDGFSATIIDVPEDKEDRKVMIDQCDDLIQQYIDILFHSHEHRNLLLTQCSEYIEMWMGKVKKMKATYAVLNMCDYSLNKDTVIAECWVPDKYLQKANEAIVRGAANVKSEVTPMLSIVATDDEPPTFHEVNKFTRNFQVIIDAYGVASYREINPAPFAIITFPFLFSLMFGDAGHALIMMAAALAFIGVEKKLSKQRNLNEIVRMFFNGRYIVLMMSLFSIFSGFIYNDFMSKPVNIFGSSWYPARDNYDLHDLHEHHAHQLNPNYGKDYTGNPYPLGMDPIWAFSENKISWLNTYKMKMSVVLGVCQMMFGNFLSLLNHLYFRDYLSIFCEFVPCVIYLTSLFGYLAFLIIYKFVMYNASKPCAPTLLIILIKMFLQGERACATNYFYPYQGIIEKVLLVLVLVTAFWILLPKPLILLYRNSAAQNKSQVSSKKPPFSFGDVFIKQCIHMIEYCLGCVSHTASYLRLWALSLAHAQLSEVIWKYMMHFPFTAADKIFGNFHSRFILIWLGWAGWAGLTVSIMLLMEGLSAFLHTLRLHWVEFQSKFYQGEGRKFQPFYFPLVLHPDD